MHAIPIQSELHSLIMAGHFAIEHPLQFGHGVRAYFCATAFTFDRWPVEASAVVLVWEPVDGWQMKPANEIRRTTAPKTWERGLFVEVFSELLPVIGKLAGHICNEVCDEIENAITQSSDVDCDS